MPTAEQYFRQLCTEAGMDEATTTALVAAANNEKLSPKFNDLVKRAVEDFPAMQGRISAADKREREYQQWYQSANTQYEQAMAELQQYRATAGNPQPDVDLSKYLTKDDLMKVVQERDANYARVIKETTRLASRHASKFNEELDVDALEKIATENGLPLSAAYDRYIAPREEERRNKDFEAKLKAAREEGAKDALSRHKLPIDPVPQQQSPLFHKPAADSIPKDIDAELLATWNGAAKG